MSESVHCVQYSCPGILYRPRFVVWWFRLKDEVIIIQDLKAIL